MLKTVGNPSTRFGNQTIESGNLVIATPGKGVDFTATSSGTGTMTSELFNDYEEGTFVPTIIGLAVTGAGNYQAQFGSYTKIGNVVFFSAYLVWSAHTGSGDMAVSGLPFNSGPLRFGTASVAPGNIALTAGNVMISFITQGVNYVNLQQTPTGGGAVTSVPVDTAGSITVSGHYFTN
jgi:hypothetical protein